MNKQRRYLVLGLGSLAMAGGAITLIGRAPAADAPRLPGGGFALTDHHGQAVSERSWPDRHLLMTFGYTYCPDICPTTLQLMSDALDLIGGKADKIMPLFVTVDPERDTPERLKEYVAHFNPRIVGLTGGSGAVARAAQNYKIRYRKNVTDPAQPEAYLMDHSAGILLMAPDGSFVKKFLHNMTPEALAEGLRTLVR